MNSQKGVAAPVIRLVATPRRGFWTDLVYWAFTPLVTRVVTGAGVAIAVFPLAYAIYGALDRDLIMRGFGPLSRLPLWLQGLAILVLGDFIGYWMHRWFHGARLWRFHAVHHSSVDLDWLSAVRLHPVNDVVMRVAGVLPILLLGFALPHPASIAGITPARPKRATSTSPACCPRGISCSAPTTCRRIGGPPRLGPRRRCRPDGARPRFDLLLVVEQFFSASSSVNGRFGSALTIAHSLFLSMKISKVLSLGISHRRLGLVGLFIPQPFPIARPCRKHAGE
jgi:hypothetical protein